MKKKRNEQEDRRHVILLLEKQAYEQGVKDSCKGTHMPYDWRFDEWDVIEAAERLQKERNRPNMPYEWNFDEHDVKEAVEKVERARKKARKKPSTSV